MFCTYGVGGGVFLIAYEDFWRKVVKSIPTSAISFFFFLSFFFLFVLFFEWSMAHVHWFHFLGQDQSTVAQQAETTDRVFPDELRVSSVPDRFPHYAWAAA